MKTQSGFDLLLYPFTVWILCVPYLADDLFPQLSFLPARKDNIWLYKDGMFDGNLYYNVCREDML